ncbi:MAG: hypothetical protein IKZ86_14830, partial [Spirochaetaceae bacterium]|nr:hypothetical protein [Spirochaetaceae bacterium]
ASSYLSLNLLNSNNEPVPPILNRDLFPEFRHEETRDKFTFYPSYEDGKLKILCEEMQHQKDKYVMESYFLIDEDKLKNNKITFSYHIYAKNITKPMTITNEINLNINRISAIELIEDELKEKDCI